MVSAARPAPRRCGIFLSLPSARPISNLNRAEPMRFSLSHGLLATLGGAALFIDASLASAQSDAATSASKLSIHGYLTQGAAASDSLLVEGIGKSGTTDYRRAALLLRYSQSPNDALVIQVAHRRLGDSPTMAFEENIKVDWAFYERRWNENTRLRVGKAPIPFGIYNETRYAGNLLPFYRAPYAMYFEGAYTSETVDGAVIMQTLLPESSFRTEISAYAGSFDLTEFTQVPVGPGQFQYAVTRSHARDAVGSQLWMSTPLSGLRVGGGSERATVSDGAISRPGEKQTLDGWHAGVDGTFNRLTTRGEYRHTREGTGLYYNGYYGQAGMRMIGALSLNAQAEASDVQLRKLPQIGDLNLKYNRDYALGVNYAATSQLMLKLEGHKTKGFNVEQGENIITGKPLDGKYMIASLSFAF
jgi:hypothetical protein